MIPPAELGLVALGLAGLLKLEILVSGLYHPKLSLHIGWHTLSFRA